MKSRNASSLVSARVGLACILLSSLIAMPGCTTSSNQQLTDLESPEDTVRIRAFDQVMAAPYKDQPRAPSRREAAAQWHAYFDQRPAIRLELIKLLERENHRASRAFDEQFSDYYSSLIGTVSSFHDPRAVTALVGAINTGSMAIDGLAELGDTAVGAVEQVARSPDRSVRHAGRWTLGTMLRHHAAKLRPENRLRVKSLLLQGLSDSLSDLRASTIRALAGIPDPDVVIAIRRIAVSDTTRVVTPNGVRFPVREAAQEWLRTQRP